jgi:hypothetical protein
MSDPDTAGLSRLLTAVIEEYETTTGYTVRIEQDPTTGTVTWTDMAPDGELLSVMTIPAEDDTVEGTPVVTTRTTDTLEGTHDE